MTIYISPNPGKTSANEIALRAAQILMNHGAAVLMCEQPRTSCSTAGVVYLPLEECLEQADVILTIGGDGTILHEANLSLRYAKPILGINLGRCGFLATWRSQRDGSQALRCCTGRVQRRQPDAAVCPRSWPRWLGGPRPE